MTILLIEPEVEDFPLDTCAVEGEGVVFQVVVRGYPLPSLTWYHEDTLLTPDYSLELLQDGSLSISSMRFENEQFVVQTDTIIWQILDLVIF